MRALVDAPAGRRRPGAVRGAPPRRRPSGSRSWSSAIPPRRPPTSGWWPTSRGTTRAIQVSLIHIPSQGDYRKRLGIDFAAGTPADIVLLNYRRYGAFAAKGVLEPLGPYLERSRVIREADFYPAGDGAVPLAGHADVHSPEPLEPRRLLQPGAVRPRRRAPAHRRLDLGRLPARRARADRATPRAPGGSTSTGSAPRCRSSAWRRSSGRTAASWSTTRRPRRG